MLNHPFMLLKSTLERLSSDFWICAVVLFLCGFLLYDPACPLAMGQQVLSVKGQKVNIWGFVSDCSHEIRRCLLLGRKAITNLDSVLKSKDITLPTKVHTVKTMFFPVVMYRCENWTIKKVEQQKNWCFWTVMQEKTLESPLDCKGIKPVNPKENQPWIFNGRIYAEAEAPILWPPDVKSQLIGKDPDAGKDWGQEERRLMEDEKVGWHHQLNGH